MYLAWISLRLGFNGDFVREYVTSVAPIPDAQSPPVIKFEKLLSIKICDM